MKQIKYFTASWCGPCKMLRPIMNELINERFPIHIVDVDNDPENLVGRYNIRSVPTCVVLEENIEVDRFSGIKTKEEIRRLISRS